MAQSIERHGDLSLETMGGAAETAPAQGSTRDCKTLEGLKKRRGTREGSNVTIGHTIGPGM